MPTTCSAVTAVSQQGEKCRAQQPRAEADREGVCRVERVKGEVATLEQQDHRDNGTEDGDLDQVGRRDAEQVAENDVVQVCLARRHRDQNQAKCEQCREDDADRGVLLHPAAVADRADHRHREEPEDDRPDGEGDSDDVGEHDTRQHCVRDGVTHE